MVLAIGLIGMMPMPDKVFIDTNIVVYSLGENSLKAHQAAPLFVGLPTISTQVVSEIANVAAKRLGRKIEARPVAVRVLH